MIKLDFDLSDFEVGLNRLEHKQMPFASSVALNRTVMDVKQNTTRRLSKDIDRPTPFTQRGIFTRPSTKTRLVAEVGFKDIQAGYLQYLSEGGTRRPNGRAIVVPVGMRLNKYGNMTRTAVRRALADPRVFSGKVKGVSGIWKRPRKGTQRKSSAKARPRGGRYGTLGNIKTLTLLATYHSTARYKKRMDFQGGAVKTAEARLPHHLRTALAKAMQTVR